MENKESEKDKNERNECDESFGESVGEISMEEK